MKARSVVFTHVQSPFSIFGLPPRMVGVAASGAFAIWMVCLAAGLAAVAQIVAAVVMVVELAVCWRLGRNDHHIESVLLHGTRFWRTSSRRWLLAGTPPMRSRGGRK